MKKIMILAVTMLVALTAAGQRGVARRLVNTDGVEIEVAKAMRPDTVMPNGEWQKVVEMQMSAKEGYKYMRQALAKIVPDYQQNVQLEDTTDCKIVAKVVLPLMAKPEGQMLYQGYYTVTLTVAMKDNRYRISGENVKCDTGMNIKVPGVDTTDGEGFSLYSKDSGGAFQRDLQFRAGQLVAKIDAMLKKQKAEDDF